MIIKSHRYAYDSNYGAAHPAAAPVTQISPPEPGSVAIIDGHLL